MVTWLLLLLGVVLIAFTVRSLVWWWSAGIFGGLPTSAEAGANALFGFCWLLACCLLPLTPSIPFLAGGKLLSMAWMAERTVALQKQKRIQGHALYSIHALWFIRVWFKRVFSAQYWISWKIKGYEYWMWMIEGFKNGHQPYLRQKHSWISTKCWNEWKMFQT